MGEDVSEKTGHNSRQYFIFCVETGDGTVTFRGMSGLGLRKADENPMLLSGGAVFAQEHVVEVG